MAQILRQSTQVIVVIGPFVDVTDGFTPETGITLGAADEAEILKANTSTTTDISAATWAAITGCDGYYALTLTTSLTDTVGPLTVMVNDDSVCLPVFARFQVIEEAAYDTIYAASALPASTTNITAGTITTATNVTTVNGLAANVITATSINADAITAAKIADGAIDAATFAAGAITATVIATGAIDADAIAADAITAAKVAADVSAEIADAVWDEDATGHQTPGSFGQAIGDPVADTNTIFKAVVTDATGATVGVDVVAVKAETASILTDTAEIGAAGAGLTNINLPNQTMDIVGNITGDLSGSVGSVTGAVGSVTGLTAATVHSDLDDIQAKIGTPVGVSVSADIAEVKAETAAIVADTNELQTDWANGGRLDLILDARASQASVDDLPTNAELATALAAADDAVLAAIAALNNLSAAQVNAEADQALADVGLTTTITGRVDAAISTRATPAQILTTALVEAYGADGAAPTLSQLLFLLLAVLTEASVSGTTLTAKKLDGSTAAATFTLNDGTNPTSISRAS